MLMGPRSAVSGLRVVIARLSVRQRELDSGRWAWKIGGQQRVLLKNVARQEGNAGLRIRSL